MKNTTIYWIFSPFLFFLFSNCSEDEKDEKEPEIKEKLELSTPSLTFVSTGEPLSFTITSDTKWEIEKKSADKWYSVTPLSGKGNMEVVIEAQENLEGKELKSELRVKTSTKSEVVSLVQGAAALYYPLLTITTDNNQPITSKEDYINATLIINNRDNKGSLTDKIFEERTEIRGRGNSTWGMEKKPYRMKLKNSVEVLGMPKNKHWVLLANYSDKTLMRNELAFEISRRMGFAYTPRMKYVDVVLNGDYIGNYMLGEHIRIDKNRVNIAELESGDQNISGGYLLEIDSRAPDDPSAIWFKMQKADMTFAISRPEELPDNQKNYISNYIQNIENILYGQNMATELPKYIDMKSFIDYLLLNELSKNVDGNLRLSTFVYKDRDNDKLYWGPVWDYDIAFGNVNYNGCENTSGWYASTASWYVKFLSQPQFKQMMVTRWKELRAGELSNLDIFIDKTAKKMNASQVRNFERWDILKRHVWPNAVVPGSYDGEVNYLKGWLKNRIAWMDNQLK